MHVVRSGDGGVEMRVRYIGMDTPEVHSGVEWPGAEAAAANAELVEGREVVLEKDVSETDQYGRALRYVWGRRARFARASDELRTFVPGHLHPDRVSRSRLRRDPVAPLRCCLERP